MARAFLTAIDLSKNELQNAVVQNLGSAPSSPVKGQIYFDSVGNILYWYNGTGWVAAQGGAGAVPATTVTTQAVGDAPVVGTATTYAREDHKHGREAFGAVTAQTTFGLTSGNGSAATLPRSDHTHGTPVHDNAAHSAINLSALAAPAANLNIGGFLLTNVGSPSSASDAATKNYVDGLVQGVSWKNSVRAASTANVNVASPGTTLDGVTLAVNDRVLLKNQTAPAENGIWVWTASGSALTRATDADTATELLAATCYVREGTTNVDTGWTMTTDAPITVGTTGLTWVQMSGSGYVTAGAGMTQSGNTLNVIAGDSSLTVAADDVRVNTAIIAPTSRTLTAGNGLTGGGDLTANRSFDVGAGTGITVAADTVALDTTFTDGRYTRKATANCAAATTTTVNHAFNTRDVVVEVYRNSTPWDTVDVDVERTDVNNVLVRFSVAPAASAFRIVVAA